MQTLTAESVTVNDALQVTGQTTLFANQPAAEGSAVLRVWNPNGHTSYFGHVAAGGAEGNWIRGKTLVDDPGAMPGDTRPTFAVVGDMRAQDMHVTGRVQYSQIRSNDNAAGFSTSSCVEVFTDRCGHGCGVTRFNAMCPAGYYARGIGVTSHHANGRFDFSVHCCRP